MGKTARVLCCASFCVFGLCVYLLYVLITEDQYTQQVAITRALLKGEQVSLEQYDAFFIVACAQTKAGFEGAGVRPFFYKRVQESGLNRKEVENLCTNVGVSVTK